MSMDPSPPQGHDIHSRRLAYQELVRRLRELVERTVPLSATVLVISKGDDDLLSFAERRGWHFPQDESGGYVGYHPRDSEAAIEALEALRARGADFLALPATATWWLTHYAEFAEHLGRHYDKLTERPDAGIVYALQNVATASVPSGGSPAEELERHRRALLIGQIHELVSHLLPAGAPVAVIDTADTATLRLDERMILPLQPTNSSAPADLQGQGTALVARLEALRRQGAAYLVVPRRAFDWWEAAHTLRSHVELEYRCVTRQQHVCLIYELDSREEAITA
jgi:hypothetical protein